MELMDVVNEHDEVIGQAEKREIYDRRLPHRIVHVWVFNDRGELAVQKRSAECGFCPLHWSMSAAGHVGAGESYEMAAARELKEELGVDLPVIFVGKELYMDPLCSETFLSVFRATSSGPFAVAEEEVESVGFYGLDDVRQMVARGEPFHPQFVYIFKTMIDKFKA